MENVPNPIAGILYPSFRLIVRSRRNLSAMAAFSDRPAAEHCFRMSDTGDNERMMPPRCPGVPGGNTPGKPVGPGDSERMVPPPCPGAPVMSGGPGVPGAEPGVVMAENPSSSPSPPARDAITLKDTYKLRN